MNATLTKHAATLPVVGISANVRQLADFKFQGAADKVLRAVFEGAGCLPLMLPAFGERYDFRDIISRLDGLVLTGGVSHINPALYGDDNNLPPHLQDRDRDATTLPLIRHAVAAGLPLFAICRGMQELNVALGGKLQTMPEDTHGFDPAIPMEEWLESDAHNITINQDGKLGTLLGMTSAAVNSAHAQCVGGLAPRLLIEAVADDGVVEAISVRDSAGFALGVQWHPEYGYDTNPISQKLFGAFGQAARSRLAQRLLESDWQQSIVGHDAVPGLS